jgi:putative ABC transport system permease protein
VPRQWIDKYKGIGGLVIGLLGAYGVTRVMSNLLFGVSTTDLMTFATVPIILLATATVAICIPALRATRVGPSGSATGGIDSSAFSFAFGP